MISPVYTWGMLLKVIFVFMLLYVIIPSKAVRYEEDSNSLIDKFFIALIHSNFITIIIVHFLAFLRIYELFSLLFCYAAVYLLVIWFRGKSPNEFYEALGLKFAVNILDMAEGRLGLTGEIKSRINTFVKSFRIKFKKKAAYIFLNPFSGLLILGVFAAAIYIRFNHSIIHLYFGASDSYVHLAWTKYLGSNNIYRDGIYPYGFHAIISALNKLFFIDLYDIIRFIGAFTGFLIVLSLYYILKKNFHNDCLILIALFFYAVDPRLPADTWRQISALPQEYAAVFMLPGIHFFNMYMLKNKTSYLILSGECLSLTLFIHPYVTVFLGIGYAVVYFMYFNLRTFIKTAVTMAVSSVIGLLPMGLAYLLGMEFHGSLGYMQRSFKPPGEVKIPADFSAFNEDNIMLVIFLISSIIALFRIIFILRKNKQRNNGIKNRIEIVILTIGWILYALYRAPMFRLPVIMDLNRVGQFLAIFAAIIISFSINIMDMFFKDNRIKYLNNSIISIIVLVFFIRDVGTVKPPEGFQMEYDEAVANYLMIRDGYPAQNWTIISPVEQYPQCIGRGWHYELWEFVQKVDKPGQEEKFIIPTDYIFLFVEKVPFSFDSKDKIMVNADDASKDFPLATDESAKYYTNGEYRRIIESKAYFWAENYMKAYNNMKVCFDDEIMRVYVINQDSKNPVNFSKVLEEQR